MCLTQCGDGSSGLQAFQTEVPLPPPRVGPHRGVAGRAGTCTLASPPASGAPRPTCGDSFQEVHSSPRG